MKRPVLMSCLVLLISACLLTSLLLIVSLALLH